MATPRFTTAHLLSRVPGRSTAHTLRMVSERQATLLKLHGKPKVVPAKG